LDGVSLDLLKLLRLIVFAGAMQDQTEIIGFDGELEGPLQELKSAGLIEYDSIIAPTDAGAATLENWYAGDRQELSESDKDFILERFRPLDREIKHIAGLWQNAVSQDDWDKRLLTIEALSALNERAASFVDTNPASLSRFKEFKQRLDAAHAKVIDGETDYFVGVRCDSYHNVWFQFHEDLLRLLARERDAE
jgi:hypothetical protein